MIAGSDALISFGAGGVGVGVGIWTAKLLGQGVVWTITFFTGRIDKKEADVDEATDRLIAGLETRLNEESEARRETEQRLRDEVRARGEETKEVRDELRDMRAQLAECNRKHADSEAKVARLEAQMQGFGDARDKVALIQAAEKKEAKQ